MHKSWQPWKLSSNVSSFGSVGPPLQHPLGVISGHSGEVGSLVGAAVGAAVGSSVGAAVGAAVGASVAHRKHRVPPHGSVPVKKVGE
mmetsp:Transcript_32501/g.97968  ORF Transcript_32501/g.97968 Transcript_32501/m.97968 type:complete len:87 (+) Transcript_32501:328-588(+)